MKWITSPSSCDDHTATNSTMPPKFEQQDDEKKQLSSPSPTDNECNNTCCLDHIRVCADCHTTKTPLWRTGPTGPKSLCNACGIRQRKARRAMAAAIMGAVGVEAAGGGVHVKGTKLEKKEKLQKKKKKKPKVVRCNNNNKANNNTIGFGGRKKKLGFEDVGTIRLNTNNYNNVNLALPQDEKEAALLLMALSYGLLRP